MFVYNPVMKTERHISLAHLHLLSTKSDTYYYSFSLRLKTSSLFCRPGLMHNFIYFAFYRGQMKNSFLLFWSGPAHWKNHLTFEGPAYWKNHQSQAHAHL